jgi:hypothetical protein
MCFNLDESDLLLNRCEFASKVKFAAVCTGYNTIASFVKYRTLHLGISATCKLLEIAH